jgi:hypothetical protein
MTGGSSTWASQRARSTRTALTLATLAFVFFGAIIVAQRFGPSGIWLGTLAAAIIGLPLAALVGTGRAR